MFETRLESHGVVSSPTTGLGDSRHGYQPLTPESMRFLEDTALDEDDVMKPKVNYRVQRQWQTSSVSTRLLHRDLGVFKEARRASYTASKYLLVLIGSLLAAH